MIVTVLPPATVATAGEIDVTMVEHVQRRDEDFIGYTGWTASFGELRCPREEFTARRVFEFGVHGSPETNVGA